MSTALALSTALDDPRSLRLEQLVALLEGFGLPWLWKSEHGWSCHVEMAVSVAGAEYKIRSGLRHRTPMAAAMECAERVRAALQSRDAGRLA